MTAVALENWEVAAPLVMARASPIDVSPTGESPLSLAATMGDNYEQAHASLALLLRASPRTPYANAIALHVWSRATAARCPRAADALRDFCSRSCAATDTDPTDGHEESIGELSSSGEEHALSTQPPEGENDPIEDFTPADASTPASNSNHPPAPAAPTPVLAIASTPPYKL